MNTAPLLADFAVRLSLGLLAAMLLISWRAVPLRFFRIQNQVVLGLLVLAALDQARSGGDRSLLGLLVAGAVAAYLATLTWGLSLPRLGVATSVTAALTAAAWLVVASWSPASPVWAMNGASRLASGFLLGATVTAMLLGHYYLTAPAMSIDPLKHVVALTAAALVGARVAGRQCALGFSKRARRSRHDLDPGACRLIALGAVGPGIYGQRHRHVLDVEDRPDPLDSIGDRHPLRRDDLRVPGRADVDGPGRPQRTGVLSGRAQ